LITDQSLREATLLKRPELVLAAMAPAKGGLHTPVQVQKLFFLIDRNIPTAVGGPHFEFKPYSYGPFDRAVYEELEGLAAAGMCEIVKHHTWNSYRLTPLGQEQGTRFLASLGDLARSYIQHVSEFVRSHTFVELVSGIYKAYPDMKVNSVFENAR